MSDRITPKPLAAHIREDGEVQTILEHLTGTAQRARQFGNDFGNGDFAYTCGIIHDIGKFSREFQKRIWEEGPKVDHSTAGAIEINKRLKDIGLLLAYCVAGHHTGLPDGGSKVDTCDESTLYGRIKRKVPLYGDFIQDIEPECISVPSRPNLIPIQKIGFSLSFYIRMIFSCLVDADYLDTEEFMCNGRITRRQGTVIEVLIDKLNAELSRFGTPTREINIKRNEILSGCMNMSANEKGLYTLTVPTGGGKTISSIAFALNHAKTNKMNRVIYAIPYTSIIEQNAGEFKRIFGEENVLEHHSGFEYTDSDEISEEIVQLKLATENWSTPIVVTTNVQFFESLFSNKPSKCRKLHNIANSVVIFDEAQMIPIQYLSACLRCITELVTNYGCTVVLCSATQPALGDQFPREINSREICEHIDEMYSFFRRTQIKNLGILSDEELVNRISNEKQILCITSTRKHAQNLFIRMPEDGSFHLSTLMYPAHRKEVIKEIKRRLKDGLPCRVVSTSLIEAGVDVDFPVVYRSVAGLDSIIQAAGRCNREGRRPLDESFLYVFEPDEKYRNHLPAVLKRPIDIMHSIERLYADISSPEAISEYFSQQYKFTGDGLDAKHIVSQMEEGVLHGMSFPFSQVADQFKIIESNTYSVVIPNADESQELTERLLSGERTGGLLKKLQMYTVNLYEKDFESLHGIGALVKLKNGTDDGTAILSDSTRYHQKMGLICPENGGEAIFW